MKQTRIKWHHIPAYSPIEITIPGLLECKAYFFNRYLLFKDAKVDLSRKDCTDIRTFELALPLHLYKNAVWATPVKEKQPYANKPCKVTFIKIKRGKMRILKIEPGE
jgi:hypothetical protein